MFRWKVVQNIQLHQTKPCLVDVQKFSCDPQTSNYMTQAIMHNTKYLQHLNFVFCNLVQMIGLAWSVVWVTFQNFKNKEPLCIILCITGNLIVYVGYSLSYAWCLNNIIYFNQMYFNFCFGKLRGNWVPSFLVLWIRLLGGMMFVWTVLI